MDTMWLSNNPLNYCVSSHTLVLSPALDQSCSRQWSVVTADLWRVKSRMNKWLFECPVINEMSAPPPPRLWRNHWRKDGENAQAGGSRSLVQHWLPTMVQPLHPWILSSCGYLHTIGSGNTLLWKEEGLVSPDPQDFWRWSVVVGGGTGIFNDKMPSFQQTNLTCVLVNIPKETHWIGAMGWDMEESRKGS